MKNINRQRKASLRILSLAMVVAVYLNWQYSRTSNDEYIFAEGDTQATNGEVMSETDMLMTDTDYENKNYGDAQLVATTKTDRAAKRNFTACLKNSMICKAEKAML